MTWRQIWAAPLSLLLGMGCALAAIVSMPPTSYVCALAALVFCFAAFCFAEGSR